MTLAIIAAVAKNRVIGKNGKIPWHIPEDLQRFKRLTKGHVVLMGRRTFESIGGPLPERRNVVVASRPVPGAETHRSLETALATLAGEGKVFAIGGEKIFARLLGRVDELYLTLLDDEFEGDTYFPPFEHLLGSTFRVQSEERHPGFRFVDCVRLK